MPAGTARPAPHGRESRLSCLAVVLLAVLVLVLASAAPAHAKSWRIDKMDVLLDVQENGDVLVDETVTFTFEGNFSFVARHIPTGNMDAITDIAVDEGRRSRCPRARRRASYDMIDENGRHDHRLNFALADTSATWTFHYRAKGVIQFCDEGDELRWYVFDAVTPVAVGAVKATVKLPGAVPPEQMTGAVETTPGVATSVYSPCRLDHGVRGHGSSPYTNFWIVAGFPKNVVASSRGPPGA